MSVLVLGGTAEARELAARLVAAEVPVVTSLAGRVERPRLPVGEVRVGGFGGVPGLVDHLREHRVRAVVDATHPFAEGISRNAAEACARADVPLLRLQRPSWADGGEPTDSGHDGHAGHWHWVDEHAEAATLAARLGRRPFLTTGRQSLHHFVAPLREHPALVRVVDPPEIELPAAWRLLRSRGPYGLADERKVMAEADVLVTKDSGGSHTAAKLAVAAERDLPVVVVRRAPPPAGVPVVHDVAAAVAWARARD
ncbi:cobalt-precorrin-6A reductase [Streptomyces oceani]|uniref:Cobalt-precorrin-6X reductase n=1 Tax=Streptomyces oceani TaxID=1075402 RepID=A0A1E7JX55_9ACTN|nr:cobalt-precorrin-6A reductase [Streptomyces oceani]OEU96217.1 cobalt-precorrin-6X reductase [Streptomyces oceani]